MQPAVQVKWSDLLKLSVRDGQLVVDVLPDADTASLVRADRRIVAEIEDSPAVWTLSTAGRVWIDSMHTIPSCHFSAWSWYDRGKPGNRVFPAMIRITPTEKTFVGIATEGDGELQITCTLRGTEQGVDLRVERVGGGPRNRVVSVHADDVMRLLEQKPAAVRSYLVPLLTALAGTNPLRPQAGDVYRAFPEIPADPEVVGKADALLPRLESPDAEDREAASAALEALGSPGVHAAMKLDRAHLSPEQASRLDRLVAAHSIFAPDAAKARSDPGFLLDCLDDADRAVRSAAQHALEKLLGKPIDYSPDLPKAKRAEAIAGIRKLVSG